MAYPEDPSYQCVTYLWLNLSNPLYTSPHSTATPRVIIPISENDSAASGRDCLRYEFHNRGLVVGRVTTGSRLRSKANGW